jgi:hypothetical protein
MATRDVVLFAIGAAAGGLVVWLATMRQLRAARSRTAERTEKVLKLAHDVRGAVTPALLMTERLEHSSDPTVRQTAALVASAMERTAELAKAASAEAQAASVAKQAQRGP